MARGQSVPRFFYRLSKPASISDKYLRSPNVIQCSYLCLDGEVGESYAYFRKAPAKINLSLDVTSKRPDGYHEVEMIMTTIDLADRIELTELPENVIRVASHNRFVPDDQRNLAYQAAKLLKERFQVKKAFRL